MELQQIHLPAPSYCGRAVRLRMLSASDIDRANELAFDRVQSTANPIKYRATMLREAVKMMIHSVTEGPVESMEAANAVGSRWRNVTVEMLDMPGDWQYERIFGARDDGVLTEFFARHHEVRRAEVDDILGKAIALTS